MEKISGLSTKTFLERTYFWTDGYFVCSVGNDSEERLRKYIENQG
ncbi:MAG: transposase [Lachnospiraceae bacterium]